MWLRLLACDKRAHRCRCVAVDVAVAKRHGATIDEDASSLHRNDEIVKGSTPSVNGTDLSAAYNGSSVLVDVTVLEVDLGT